MTDTFEDLTESLAPSIRGCLARCAWIRGERRRPFQTTERERPNEYRWSADGSTMWTRPTGGGEWSQWDPRT